MNSKQSQINDFERVCREHKLKLTPQRQIIFEEFADDKSHPTADEVYNRINKNHPNISFDTVNRTLLTLAEIGLLNTVVSSKKAKRYDPDLSNHHHFECIKCHRIIDFELEVNINIPKSLNNLEIINKRIVLEGICNKCKKI